MKKEPIFQFVCNNILKGKFRKSFVEYLLLKNHYEKEI